MAERGLRFDLIARDKSFSKTLDAAGRKGERLNRQFTRTLGQTGDNAGRQFGLRLNKRLGAGLSATARVARVGAGAIGAGLAVAGLAQFATDSVRLAATFDKTMRQVAQVTRTPTRRIEELRKVALDMGATTSFSASQAADAMLQLGKGGLTFAEQKAGALQATLTLAAAGSLELGDAAGFVVQGLRTFGLRADKAASVAAALAGAANASTANVEDMGLSLAQAGAQARNAGLTIQETTGVLAAFANNGIAGSDAGTSLKTMLQRLVPATAKARDAMKDLGLKFTDAKGAILPIPEIAQRLQDRLSGLSDAQRIAALNTIFGSDAIRAASILMREGRAGVEKYIKATSDRAAAEKLAKTNTEGAAGAFERLQGAVETIQIQIGDAFLPVLADAANWLARVLPAALSRVQSALQTAGQWWRENREEIDLIVRALTVGFNPAADQAATSTNNLADAASKIYGFLGRVAEAVARVSQAYNALIIASQSVSFFFGNLIQSIGHFINAVDAASKFLVPFGDHVGHAGDAIVDLGRDIENKALGAINNAQTGIGQASTAIQGLRANTTNAATAAQQHATALYNEKTALDALKGALQGEEIAELDVRQAKLNVQTAQKRLNELKATGRTRSIEYKQAQIDLKRAQIDLKAKTDAYRASVAKTTDAERTAASASTAVAGAVRGAGQSAHTAAGRFAAFGKAARDAILRIPNRRVNVSANYQVGAPKGVELLIEKGLARAGGGPINGPGTTTSDDIPAWLSDQEHVVDAKAVKGIGRGSYRKGHQVLNGMRQRARGYRAGGPVLDFQQTGGREFLARPKRFDRNIQRAIDLSARGFVRTVRANFDKIFGAGKPEIKRFIRGTDPLPYIWGGAGPGGYDCSGLVGAVYGKHTGRGGGHGQRYFTTASIGTGVPGLKGGLGGTLEIGVTSGSGHMAGKYGDLKFEARSTRSGIIVGGGATDPRNFARRYHLARGGQVSLADLVSSGKRLDIGGDTARTRAKQGTPFRRGEFDRGGYLMPGMTVAHNRTGRPERVIGPREQLIEYDKLGRAVANALAQQSFRAYMDPNHARQQLKDAQRRAGVPAREQVR